jgi:polysaccharide pyruvyl transferase WcaK-like protein
MHACIIAYSLDIPAVGLVWNEKLTFWGKSIGLSQNFISLENNNSSNIVDCLEKSMKTSYDAKTKEEYVNTGTFTVREMLNLLDNGK